MSGWVGRGLRVGGGLGFTRQQGHDSEAGDGEKGERGTQMRERQARQARQATVVSWATPPMAVLASNMPYEMKRSSASARLAPSSASRSARRTKRAHPRDQCTLFTIVALARTSTSPVSSSPPGLPRTATARPRLSINSAVSPPVATPLAWPLVCAAASLDRKPHRSPPETSRCFEP